MEALLLVIALVVIANLSCILTLTALPEPSGT
jgi:hypothetical protein